MRGGFALIPLYSAGPPGGETREEPMAGDESKSERPALPLLRIDDPMQIEGGRADPRLTQHHMNLAAMMSLVIEEMRGREGRLIDIIQASIIRVRDRSGKEIFAEAREELFDPGILGYPVARQLGETLRYDRIERWCFLPSPLEALHPDSVAQEHVVQKPMDTAERAAPRLSVLCFVQQSAGCIHPLVRDPVIPGKVSE